jgi:tripartite-type tricarboxylate transporter receptor subunit TctC
MFRRSIRIAAAVLTWALAGAVAAQTPAWPTATVKIIVPFTPGTGMDTIARTVAPRLAEKLG